MRWLLLAGALVLTPLSCRSGADDPPVPIAAAGGSDQHPVVPLAGARSDSGGSGGQVIPAGLRCDRCGAGREVCAPKLVACAEDPACEGLLDCVYGSSGCSLDAGGARCTSACLLAACANPQAVTLFLEADRCAYCTSACRDACATYCETFVHDDFTCLAAGGAGGQVAASSGHGGQAGAGG